MKIREMKVPYHKTQGVMIFENYSYSDNKGFQNCIFEDHIKYVGFGRGRSAVHCYFESMDGTKKFTMFMSEFDKIIRAGKDVLDLKGKFYFVKRGMNYSLAMVLDEDA